MKTIIATDLKIGDKVQLDKSGEFVTVTQITNGMIRGHLMIHWKGDWGSVSRSSQVFVK